MYKFIIYKAKDGWRWRYVAPNGRIMAVSGEGLHNKVDLLESMEVLKEKFRDSKIYEEEK